LAQYEGGAGINVDFMRAPWSAAPAVIYLVQSVAEGPIVAVLGPAEKPEVKGDDEPRPRPSV